MDNEMYLGDAVYVSFDGFNLWLRCANPPGRIALEPATYAALTQYVERLKGRTTSAEGG